MAKATETEILAAFGDPNARSNKMDRWEESLSADDAETYRTTLALWEAQEARGQGVGATRLVEALDKLLDAGCPLDPQLVRRILRKRRRARGE